MDKQSEEHKWGSCIIEREGDEVEISTRVWINKCAGVLNKDIKKEKKTTKSQDTNLQIKNSIMNLRQEI